MTGQSRGKPGSLILAVLMLLATLLLFDNSARAYTSHSPILIAGNGALTLSNGVTGGQGTVADPYVIEGWEVNASSTYADFAGIDIRNTTASIVIRNVFVHSGVTYGIALRNVSNVRMEQVTLSGNDIGLGIRSSDRVSLVRSSAPDNYRIGVSISRSTQVTIAGSVIADTRGWAIYTYESSGVLVHHNNFVGNAVQASDSGPTGNQWNLPYPGGGNYWSTYSGQDRCGGPRQDDCTGPDGFGDTPFVLDADSADRYPILAPVQSTGSSPVAHFTVSPSVTSAPMAFNVDASSSWDLEDRPESLEVRWDWQGDGAWDTGWSTTKVVSHRYTSPGNYTIQLEVRDADGLVGVASNPISVNPAADQPLPTLPFALTFGALLLAAILVGLWRRRKKQD